MKNWWIQFGCFLTGYNYDIIRNSSEVAAKMVKRYTASLIIVGILWSFIGYSFTDRYIHTGLGFSLIGAAVFVIIIIQIERQIILSPKSNGLYTFRSVIAMMMAIIGAVIIDQIIFKADIELEKSNYIEERVKKAIIPKKQELNSQILALDSVIRVKELERKADIDDVRSNPSIKVTSIQTTIRLDKSTTVDSTTGKSEVIETSKPISTATQMQVPNPKISLIEPSGKIIEKLYAEKSKKDSLMLNIRPELEKEIKSKVGLLDELNIMYGLMEGSKIALIFWFIWFFFLLGLELLVLISKMNEKEENDYEKTVKHHMDLQIKRLDLLAKLSEKND